MDWLRKRFWIRRAGNTGCFLYPAPCILFFQNHAVPVCLQQGPEIADPQSKLFTIIGVGNAYPAFHLFHHPNRGRVCVPGVVFCQTERSQFQNRDNAIKMLKAKLAELKMQQQAEKISDIKGVQMKIEWGSQIRSYVFMPYTLAKDTRTGYEMGNIQAVMDGDIDGFINAYLSMKANGELK